MKVEVTEGMLAAAFTSQRAATTVVCETIIRAALSHPDCQRQLRDMVLAAVPEAREVNGYDEQHTRWLHRGRNDFRAETLANLATLFGEKK